MKLVARIVSIAAAFIFCILACGVVLIYFNQHRLIVAVLSSIKNQTGVEIISPHGGLEVRDHLIVVLERPRVMTGGREVVAMDRIRAVVNFHSLFFSRGLPLHDLVLDGAVLNAPFDAAKTGDSAIPRPGHEMINQSLAMLGNLALVSRRLVISNLKLNDQAGAPILRNAQVFASHRRSTPKLWKIGFTTELEAPRFAGTHVSGDFNLGEGGALPATLAAQGTMWFWNLPLRHVTIGNLEVDGQSQGEVKISVAKDATIEGLATIDMKALKIASPDLSAPMALGDYSIEANFNTSSEKVTMSNAKLTHEGKPIAAGQAYIQKPFEQNPKVSIGVAGLRIAWNDVLAPIRALKRVPQEVGVVVRRVKSGKLQIENASFEAPINTLENMTLETFLKKVSLNATLTEVSFATPPETQLPDVTGASVKLLFSKQILTAVQGIAKLGKSELSDINARLDLSRNLNDVPYSISAKADLDLAELKPATVKLLDSLEVHERDRLLTMQGDAHVELEASGSIRKNVATRPEKYLAKVEPHNVTIEFRGAPGPLGIASGTIIAQPSLIRLDRVSARATGGTADFNGDLRIDNAGVATRGLRITMHQMPIEQWMASLVDPDDFGAAGNVGGEVTVTGDLQNGLLANGKLTLTNGKVQFGFLRSPILVHPAIVTVRDHTLVVSMPAAELEKSPIDFNVAVADLRTPSIRIDANVQKLDVEVMKFVRLPWMPPSPTHPPNIPITGHVEAREANLESFPMKNAKTDFKFIRGDWSVDNLTATSFEGHVNINLVGRKKDDWIRMFGKIQNMNVASLFLLGKKFHRSPISGRLDLTGDVWANTNTDFFATMGGTAIVKLRDGNLDKFALLSRLLAFIDLRSWITANVPDPRISGIQFRTVTADFKGSDGVFYTDDLILDGPVIDIVANGDVNLGQSTLDMKIGMIPFNTVNWILSGIPLVGKNVAGSTKSIIAAYFNARGPIANPSVTPAPITSVAELAKKIIGLPVNLIKPGTIK
jgi:hypothetical protein